MQDPDMTTTGYGMVMQLRKNDAIEAGGSSGFEGVERLDLLKNVHVVIRDVGKSGIDARVGSGQESRPTARARPRDEIVEGRTRRRRSRPSRSNRHHLT